MSKSSNSAAQCLYNWALCIAMLATLATLAACGGNSAANDNANGSTENSLLPGNSLVAITTATLASRQALVDHMEDRYLWYQDLPALDISLSKYADLRVLLDDLRKQPEDRFSVLIDTAAQQQRIEGGVSGSYGLRFTERTTGDAQTNEGIDIRIAGVNDFGSVALAGIQRGDRIIGAEGKSIEELGLDGFREIFTEPGLGVERSLQIRHPDGSEQNYTIRRTEHPLNPVRKQAIFTDPDTGRRVGYVLVEEFIRLTSEQLETFRADYASLGLDDLIIDLRYNGGGLVSASRDLASSVYGQGQVDDIYTTLQRNDKHTNENFTFHFRQFDNAFMSLERVFILTTRSTCSASEEVINGLKPFMDVITIGDVTCGKPYASRSYDLIADLVSANVLDSRSVNALGEGDFFEGITPTCLAADDPILPYNDPRESLVSVALHYAEFNECPIAEQLRQVSGFRNPSGNYSMPITDEERSQGAILP